MVGTLRERLFNRIPASPEFHDVSEARNWVAGYAENHSELSDAEYDRQAWQFLQAPGNTEG
jgi:hypothetical protein